MLTICTLLARPALVFRHSSRYSVEESSGQWTPKHPSCAAREHNLRGVNLELPRNKLIVFTGVSGSGKSSLAFDTIYAEGQRRYVESLSSYARQFLGQLPKPDVDYIGGLSPSVSIQQKTAGRNPRSTVGTITEVSDFLRVLYARLGQGHCPKCQRPITARTPSKSLAHPCGLPEDARVPASRTPGRLRGKSEVQGLLRGHVEAESYVRRASMVQVVKLTDDLKLDKRIKHTIEIVVDRLKADTKNRPRIAEAVEQALALAEGNLIISVEAEAITERKPPESDDANVTDILLSAHYACTHCNIEFTSRRRRSCSASTTRTGCARRATVSARSTPSTPTCSSPIRP